LLVVSNNEDSSIKRVVEKFDLDYVARALKPSARGLKLAEKKLGLKPSEMLMFGDQIMTDIQRANAARIRNVLVQPIVATDR
ncbi:HAD family hydrolase, partial [Enterococcus faecalis]|uniref:HAD family hydrolase n=1 Tax=Enterococcus faecalis TaxID=1351 RepID=UPI003D6B47A3